MRMSKKHVTHIGPEARTLSSKPLPPSLSLPPHPTRWHEVVQLGEAATPAASGAGRAAQRGASARGPSPGTLQGFILCPRLEGQEGSGRPESPRKTDLKRRRDQREERTENGRGCREAQRGPGVEAEPSAEQKASRRAGAQLSPRPGPSGPCVLLAPLVRWRALGGEVFSERLAPSSKPTQRTAHTHTDAWAPPLPQGRGVDQRPETQTPSDSACEKLPGDFRSALPHSLAPGSYLETWKVLLRF